MAKKRTKKPPKGRAPKSWPERFIEALAETGVIRDAAARANVSRTPLYELKRTDPAFAAAWEQALEDATDAMVSEARRRAVSGVPEPVFYQGEEVGTVRRYSDSLLMFLIKKERPAYRDGRPDTSDAAASSPRIQPRRRDDRPRQDDPG